LAGRTNGTGAPSQGKSEEARQEHSGLSRQEEGAGEIPPACFPRLADPPVSSALPHSRPALPIGAATTPLTHSGPVALAGCSILHDRLFFSVNPKKKVSHERNQTLSFAKHLCRLLTTTPHISLAATQFDLLRFLLFVHDLVLGVLDPNSL
jgi:hypothetical protein